MPNNPYRNATKKFLKALDDPHKLAAIRRDAALYLLGLSTGLLAAEIILWSAIAACVGLWLLWRSQAQKTPKIKLEQIVETPPEM